MLRYTSSKYMQYYIDDLKIILIPSNHLNQTKEAY